MKLNLKKPYAFVVAGVVWGIVSFLPYFMMVGGYVPVSRTTAIFTFPGWLACRVPYLGEFDSIKFLIPPILGGFVGYMLYLLSRLFIFNRAPKEI